MSIGRLASALCLTLFAAVPALAETPFPPAGAVTARMTPCLMAKHRKQNVCKEPEMVAGLSDSDAAELHHRRAMFFIDVVEQKAAAIEIDEALKLQPKSTRFHHLAARLALSSGDYARAEREVKTALELSPGDPDVLATDASRLEFVANPYFALEKFDAIVVRYPEHTYSREQRARLLLNSGNYKKAIEDLDILVTVFPTKAAFWAQRGIARISTGAVVGATEDLSKALDIEPNNMELINTRAVAFELIEKDEAALLDYNSILGPVGGKPRFAIQDEDRGRLYMRRALLLVRLKRLDDAAEDGIAALQGGTSAVLRLQVFLRQHGFPEIPLDGRSSNELRATVRACFGLRSCFERITETL